MSLPFNNCYYNTLFFFVCQIYLLHFLVLSDIIFVVMLMNKRRDIIVLVVVSIIFVCLLSLFIINFNRRNIVNELKKLDETKSEVKPAGRAVNGQEVENNSNDNSIVDNNSGEDIKEVNNENDVLEYFEFNYNNMNSNNIKDDIKKYFIDIVDFIFYDKEIKGYTFKEISDNTKIKIIAIALKFDNKINEYFPGYKESISDNGNKIYSNVKEKLVTSYLDLSIKICSNNEVDCEKAKDIFSDVKSNCKIGWDFIKKIIGDGGNKLKDWYEIYSGKR